MSKTDSNARGYALAALMGAIGGGLVVALATNAIPKVLSRVMQTMMVQMREAGFNPAEM